MDFSESQVNEINEDQEANELFKTFMDITKDAAFMDHQPNNSTDTEKDKQQSTVDNTMEEEETAMQVKEIEEKTVERKNGSEKDLPDEAQGNVSKSLSKAVNELSDLEKQLSLMISEGPKHCTKQENVSSNSDVAVSDGCAVIDNKEEGVIISVNEEKSRDAKDSEPKSTESANRETIWADEDAETNPNTVVTTEFKGNGEKETSGEKENTNFDEAKVEAARSTEVTTEFKEGDEKETSGEKENTDFDEAKDIKVEGNTEITTNPNDDVRDAGNQGVHEHDASKLPPSASHDGVAESNEDNADEKKDENVESSNLANEDTPDDASSQKLDEKEDVDQTIINVSNPEVKVHEGGKQDEGVNEKPEDAKEDGSKESVTEVQDEIANRKSSSGAEIEILMTDESGISERKSLDSLDSLDDDNHHGQPDSPALSDEGIDSDSKSDMGEDDTFDTSSSDFFMKSKSNSLEVDRSRIGSDSSTLSEQEFKRDLSDATDGVIGEALDHISIQGYLLKLGGSGLTPRNWRKRWFVLKGDNCLYYYKHSKEKVPCGVIVLCNYSITKAPEYSKKCCFKLNKGGARSYHLCASNDDEMREWMVALMAAANEIAPDGSSFQISEGNVHNVSIPALSIRDPECHGYLSKQGHNIKNWKRRYCVLKNGYLYYYSDMSNTTALGVAKLLGYSIKMGDKRGKHYCFYGSPSDESLRTYHFSAETENDRDRWMTRMEESIHKGNMSNYVTSE